MSKDDVGPAGLSRRGGRDEKGIASTPPCVPGGGRWAIRDVNRRQSDARDHDKWGKN